MKYDDIISAVEEMCLCEIGHSNVDEESFTACTEKMPEYVTFRARLSGTSDYDSEYLASFLVKWVSTSPSIFVNGLELNVANDKINCTTILSDNEGDCLNDIESSSGDNVGKIIAIAVPSVAAFVGFITIVSFAVTIWTKCSKY